MELIASFDEDYTGISVQTDCWWFPMDVADSPIASLQQCSFVTLLPFNVTASSAVPVDFRPWAPVDFSNQFSLWLAPKVEMDFLRNKLNTKQVSAFP